MLSNSNVTPMVNTVPMLKAIDLEDFINMKLPEREPILSPWLYSQGLTMIYAPRGIGKTHVSLGIAYAVASGGEFLGWQAEHPSGVLFIDGEMPASLLQERLTEIMLSNDKQPVAPLKIITPDLQPNGIPDLASLEGQAAINNHVTEDIKLIIVDNLSTCVHSGKENEGESWLPVQQWALQLRSQGKSVIFIHHSGKGGNQRGTSRREDVLDTVIALKRPSDYRPEQGACFEIHYEKSRGVFGDAVSPFKAQLFQGEDSSQTWMTQALEDSNQEKILQMLKDGMSQADIARELGLNRSTVSRAAAKLAEEGRFIPK